MAPDAPQSRAMGIRYQGGPGAVADGDFARRDEIFRGSVAALGIDDNVE